MTTDNDHRGYVEDLRDHLQARRRELTGDLQRRMARIRQSGADPALAKEMDNGDPSDLDVRLLEIVAATLHRIDLAIERLDDGRYGRCTRCQARISEVRLRAMPFAVCCQACETTREREAASNRHEQPKKRWVDGYTSGGQLAPEVL
jgi:DnaK suppressor protein